MTTMTTKCSGAQVLVLLLSLGTATLIQGPVNVDAAPISRLLSAPPPSPPSLSSLAYAELSETYQPHPQEEQKALPLVIQAQPSLGRVQIPRLRDRFQTQRLDVVRDITSYLLHQQYQQELTPTPFSPTPVRSALPQQHSQQQMEKVDGWSWHSDDRTLEGHAVLDDDDDDAGNELLDTEAEDTLQLDMDDEIDGMMDDDMFEEEVDGIDLGGDGETAERGRRGADEVWKGMIHKYSEVAGLTRKEALLTQRVHRLATSP
ncbi:MAG: hypothetical protein J3Q66DRAFT_327902 [Benniella sp.]|nr:MAG: hypothetical protein J3Q66DRAFT_327902 [Benniella sp.]